MVETGTPFELTFVKLPSRVSLEGGPAVSFLIQCEAQIRLTTFLMTIQSDFIYVIMVIMIVENSDSTYSFKFKHDEDGDKVNGFLVNLKVVVGCDKISWESRELKPESREGALDSQIDLLC